MYNCVCDICQKTEPLPWHDSGGPMLPDNWSYIGDTGARHPRYREHICDECRKIVYKKKGDKDA